MLNLTLNHSLGFYRFCFSKQTNKQTNKKQVIWDFPGGPAIKNMPANAEEVGLIQEDPTGWGATKPVCGSYRAHVPQPLKPQSSCSTIRELVVELQWEAQTAQGVAPARCKQRKSEATKTQHSQKLNK